MKRAAAQFVLLSSVASVIACADGLSAGSVPSCDDRSASRSMTVFGFLKSVPAENALLIAENENGSGSFVRLAEIGSAENGRPVRVHGMLIRNDEGCVLVVESIDLLDPTEGRK